MSANPDARGSAPRASLFRRLWFPVLMGVVGMAVLLELGLWQLRRLEWKNAVIATMEQAIGAEPRALPDGAPDPARDRYLPVLATGALGGEEVHVLTSIQGQGPGYRVVSALTTGDRRVMVDLGFVPEEAIGAPRMAEAVTVTGNLVWPDETDGFTPDPDTGKNIWFARDVPRMAAALGTEPVLVVARIVEPDLGTTPLPVDTSAVKNDHWEYAVTWFSLAVVWAAMSAVLVWRQAQGQGRVSTKDGMRSDA